MDKRKVTVEELEAMIAEFVMGLDVREVVQQFAAGHGNIVESIVWVVSNGENYEDCPKFARDANATLEVVDRMGEEDYFLHLDVAPKGKLAYPPLPTGRPGKAVAA